MKTKLFLLMGIVGVLIACHQHKPAAEEGISQSVYMDKLDRSLEARIFQNDETLMLPESLPDDWEQQLIWADFKYKSWFNEYYDLNDTVFSETEMSEIFKAVFENDSVLNMIVDYGESLQDNLKRYDVAFFNRSDAIRAPMVLKNGIVLNFNSHPTSKMGMNVLIRKLPNSILWIELHYQTVPHYTYSAWLEVYIQIKGNTIRPIKEIGMVET